MMKDRQRIIKQIVNVLLLVLCIGFLYWKIDFRKVKMHIANVKYSIFVFTVLISLIRAWLLGLRWEVLHPSTNSNLTKWSYFRFTMLSLLFNKFMPGAFGGDIVKTIYAIKEQKSQKLKNIIAVFVDRAVGLISILIFGIFSLFITKQKLEINIFHFILILLSAIGVITLISHQKVISFMSKLALKIKFKQNLLLRVISIWSESVYFYKNNKNKLLISFLLCIPIHLASFVSFFIFAKALNISITFFELIFVIAIMWLITSLPISIGGMGVREISLVWLLGFFNVTSELAVTLSVMAYINATFIILLALPLLIDFRKKRSTYMNEIIEKND